MLANEEPLDAEEKITIILLRTARLLSEVALAQQAGSDSAIEPLFALYAEEMASWLL